MFSTAQYGAIIVAIIMRNRDYKICASWSELPQNSSFGQRPRRGRWPMAPPHTRIAPFFSLSLFFSSIPYGAPFGSSEATIQIPGESNDCNWLNNKQIKNTKYNSWVEMHTTSKQFKVTPVLKKIWLASKPEHLGHMTGFVMIMIS